MWSSELWELGRWEAGLMPFNFWANWVYVDSWAQDRGVSLLPQHTNWWKSPVLGSGSFLYNMWSKSGFGSRTSFFFFFFNLPRGIIFCLLLNYQVSSISSFFLFSNSQYSQVRAPRSVCPPSLLSFPSWILSLDTFALYLEVIFPFGLPGH